MKKVFCWKQMGFAIEHESKHAVDLAQFKRFFEHDKLEQLFLLGYTFWNDTHQIRLESIEDYNKYILN